MRPPRPRRARGGPRRRARPSSDRGHRRRVQHDVDLRRDEQQVGAEPEPREQADDEREAPVDLARAEHDAVEVDAARALEHERAQRGDRDPRDERPPALRAVAEQPEHAEEHRRVEREREDEGEDLLRDRPDRRRRARAPAAPTRRAARAPRRRAPPCRARGAAARPAARTAARPRCRRARGRARSSRPARPTARPRGRSRAPTPLPLSDVTSSSSWSPSTGMRPSAVSTTSCGQVGMRLGDDPEQRDERQQEREQRQERVVRDQRRVHRRAVVDELARDADREGEGRVPLLPAVDGGARPGRGAQAAGAPSPSAWRSCASSCPLSDVWMTCPP